MSKAALNSSVGEGGAWVGGGLDSVYLRRWLQNANTQRGDGRRSCLLEESSGLAWPGVACTHDAAGLT